MQFSFTVGNHEQHRVDFSFDQFIGNLEIKVDGQPAVKDFRFASLKLTKRYDFVVGFNEKHQVAIEKKRKFFSPACALNVIASSSMDNWSRPTKVKRNEGQEDAGWKTARARQ